MCIRCILHPNLGPTHRAGCAGAIVVNRGKQAEKTTGQVAMPFRMYRIALVAIIAAVAVDWTTATVLLWTTNFSVANPNPRWTDGFALFGDWEDLYSVQVRQSSGSEVLSLTYLDDEMTAMWVQPPTPKMHTDPPMHRFKRLSTPYVETWTLDAAKGDYIAIKSGGWPFRSHWAGVKRGPTSRLVIAGLAAQNVSPRTTSFTGGGLQAIPLGVHWRGKLANVAIFATGLVLAVGTASTTKTRLRKRRGLCPHCGFDISKTTNSTCSECGLNVR